MLGTASKLEYARYTVQIATEEYKSRTACVGGSGAISRRLDDLMSRLAPFLRLAARSYCMFSSKFTILGKPIQTCVKSAPEIESHVHNRDDSVSTAAPAKNAGAAAGRAV